MVFANTEMSFREIESNFDTYGTPGKRSPIANILLSDVPDSSLFLALPNTMLDCYCYIYIQKK